MISCAVIVMSTAFRNASMSKRPFFSENFMRFIDDRLQAESSRNMYSEHGFDALIRAVFLQGCQRFTVVSNCMPGSPHWGVASAICRIRSRALYRATGLPAPTERVHHSPSSATACMNSSEARTELLAFWKKMEL